MNTELAMTIDADVMSEARELHPREFKVWHPSAVMPMGGEYNKFTDEHGHQYYEKYGKLICCYVHEQAIVGSAEKLQRLKNGEYIPPEVR